MPKLHHVTKNRDADDALDPGDDLEGLLQRCLDCLVAGDPAARNDLFRIADAQLVKRARQMLRGNRAVRTSYDTCDVAQEASLRLMRSLEAIHPENPQRFLGLVGLHVRRALFDLHRKCHRDGSEEANRATNVYVDADGERRYWADEAVAPSENPDQSAWERLHLAVERLDAADQELFDLRWFLEMTHAQIAAQRGCSEKTVKRDWIRIKDFLRRAGGDDTDI